MNFSAADAARSTHLPADRYLDLLRADSARFADALSAADPAARVPSCPDWDADDLLWHLTEVQWFWGTIAADRLQEPSGTDGRRPVRPASKDELLDLFRRTSAALSDALGAADDAEPVWTWLSTDRTIGFIRRRQAHEALIHRVDAELVAGEPTPLDAALATDGVDEAVQIMFGGIPDWATFTREHGPVGMRTSDTGARWVVDVGRQAGVDPDSGEHVDEPTLHFRDDDAETVAEIVADAATLDCWLWGRADNGAVITAGDQTTLAAYEAVIRSGID